MLSFEGRGLNIDTVRNGVKWISDSKVSKTSYRDVFWLDMVQAQFSVLQAFIYIKFLLYRICPKPSLNIIQYNKRKVLVFPTSSTPVISVTNLFF